MKRHIVLLILLLVICISQAQVNFDSTKPSVTLVIDNSKGLADQNVFHTIRDSSGYFYFFMYSAIQRWDGTVLEDIIKPEDHTGLQFSNIRDLHLVGPNSILYIDNGYIDQVYIINVMNKSVKKIPLPQKSICFYTPKYLILQDENGSVYAMINWDQEQPSQKYLAKTEEIQQVIQNGTQLYLNTRLKTHYLENWQYKKAFDFSGLIGLIDNDVYGFKDNEVWRFKNKSLHQIDVIKNLKGSNRFPYKIKNNADGDLIVAYDNKDYILRNVFLFKKGGVYEDFTSLVEPLNERCLDIIGSKGGRKWILTTYNGVFIYQYPISGISRRLYIDNIEAGDYGFIYTGMYIRNEFILFLEEGNKLIRYNINSKKFDEPFKNYIDNTYPQTGLNSSLPSIDPSIKTYFLANQKIKKLPGSDYVTYSFYSYTADSISFLHRFTTLQETPETFTTVPFRIEDIEPISSNKLLIGGRISNEAKLGILDIPTKEVKYIDLPDDFPTIKTITLDSKNNAYFLSTFRGVWILDKNYALHELSVEPSKSYDFLMQTSVITSDRWDDKIIMASKNGLFYLNEKDNQIHIINESNGLTHQICYASVIDDNNNLWVTTQNGITVFNEDMSILKTIEDYDGLGPGNGEFNTEAAIKDKNGILYFGTINGLIIINPQLVLESNSDKGFDITEAILYKNSKIKEIYQPKNFTQIVSDSKFDSIVLQVKRPDYIRHSSDNFYGGEINISKLPAESITWKEDRIHISNLKSPKFSFEIANNSLVPLYQLNITYKKDLRFLLSLFIGFSLIALLSVLISRMIIDRMKTKNFEKLQLERKMSNMRLSTLQSQMNPHFIFNSLGSIQYYMQTHDIKSAEKYLTEFAKLTRLFLESSKSKTFLIKDEIELLMLYLSMEQNRFSDKFDYEFHVDSDLDMTFEIPPMVLQPFLENAINHGVRHLKDKRGVIQISFKHVDEDVLRCTIVDNGIGREASKKLKSSTTHKSRAMEILNEKIELLKNSKGQRFDFTIMDMADDCGQALGTKIIVDFH